MSTPPKFSEAARTWAYIGLNSFGGPAGQIAVMHRVLVEDKKWISEERFLHALNFCMLLPGPEAQQLSVYIGWLLHGVRGGLTAGLLFILPGAAAILALSFLYVGLNEIHSVQSLFFGLKAAVLAIVAEAVLRIGRRALKTRFHLGIAAAAFTCIFLLEVPLPAIVAAAALIGFFHTRLRSANEERGTDKVVGGAADAKLDNGVPEARLPTLLRTLGIALVWSAIWFSPMLLIAATLGRGSLYFQMGAFFSKAAVVTFGGAYSVLAYVAQAAVEEFGWMRPGEMLDGLALAETTPGPLIMVVQFVGFLAAARNAGELPPMLAGTLGGLLATWVTFAPCFLWIFLGAPYIEALRKNRSLSGALAAIAAAVVGVVVNLSVWMSLHTLFQDVSESHVAGIRLLVPHLATVDWPALALSLAALVATFRFHLGTMKVLTLCALGGLALRLLWH